MKLKAGKLRQSVRSQHCNYSRARGAEEGTWGFLLLFLDLVEA
jgi:hypothetical protein